MHAFVSAQRPARPRLLVFTGAGLSADSGLATFRTGATPVWAGASIDEVNNIATWQANYDRVHRFYNARRAELARVVPNAMHRAIAAWEARYDTVLFTLNVDDLLARAGCRAPLHVHGSLREMTCMACQASWSVGYATFEPAAPCPRCGAARRVKPGVSFTGEDSPLYALLDQTFRLDAMHDDDVTLVIGTSGYSWPLDFLCWRRPGFKILNNLEPSPHIRTEQFDRVLYGRAVDMVTTIDALLAERLGRFRTAG